MGEDFFRRKNDRFVRQRDKCLSEEFAPDIFSACPPETEISVYGMLCDGMSIDSNDTLWAPTVSDEGPVRFYSGKDLVLEVEGPGAEHLRQEYLESHSPVIAQIIQVEPEHGLAMIRVNSAARAK